MADQVLTVSALTRFIRSLLEAEVGDVVVEGEISNHRLQSSGHQYFTLKDETAQLSCVLFRGAGLRVQTPLRDGMQVQVSGGITVYEARGNYQLIVRSVQPKGQGSLQQRFEALKQKLAAEGLFDPERKQAIPRHPRCVALITSPTGAAIRDMLSILTRRSPWVRILVFPVRVQGQGAELEIARAVQMLNRAGTLGLPVPDTLVVGRGGGSLEDLWCFNEEVLARAIAASNIPVISAVGHETDFTIADFVADLRAPTPSAAAELLAPDAAEMRRHFEAVEQRLRGRAASVVTHRLRELELMERGPLRSAPPRHLREAEQRVDDAEAALHDAAASLLRRCDDALIRRERTLERLHPLQLLAMRHHRLDLIQQRLSTAATQREQRLRERLTSLRQLLKGLGPDRILARGFSITTDATGKVLHDATALRPGDMVISRLGKGSFSSVVTK